MSVIRKLVYAICEQLRSRSVQSDRLPVISYPVILYLPFGHFVPSNNYFVPRSFRTHFGHFVPRSTEYQMTTWWSIRTQVISNPFWSFRTQQRWMDELTNGQTDRRVLIEMIKHLTLYCYITQIMAIAVI